MSLSTGWIETSFTNYSQEFFLAPSFETRYIYYCKTHPAMYYQRNVIYNSKRRSAK